LVTAGPTYEKIDPVRYIGNHSSGKMGFAIAEALADQGAKVILIAGPVSVSTHHPSIIRNDVVSAKEMFESCVHAFPDCDGAIMCAAVADFTPVITESSKIKRGKENYTIELMPTQDIAAELGRIKRSDQLLVGFALETNDEVNNASEKLRKKNLDFIVLNSLNDPGAGFRTDTNKISIIGRDNKTKQFELKLKADVAIDIVDAIIEAIG
jgi:phosphopantothenoylcysteine decarboxylase / phosphopantothenate---cysteine ligase